MNNTQAQRLLNVAKSLRESKTPKRFTMNKFVWGEMDRLAYDLRDVNAEKFVQKERDFCGTPACALGHFGARTDLQSLLKIRTRVVDGEKIAGLEYSRGLSEDQDKLVSYLDKRVQKYFGIDEGEADRLFGPDGCGNAKSVNAAANFIERFVQKNRNKK